MSGLLDFITGGQNQKAQEALAQALQGIRDVHTPTTADLTMTPLSEYASTGSLTPAQMEAAQAGPSAFDAENLSSVPMSTMQEVLAKEKEIAAMNGMTPQERAAIARTMDTVNANTAGNRGAIAQDFAGRGVPASLIAAALQNGAVGQEAQQGYLSALQAEGAASDRGVTALNNEGALAGKMFDQNANQANTVAAARDALEKFNTTNTQAARTTNVGNQQAANVYDTTNKQNIANENVTGQHQVQVNNQVEAPKTAAAMALDKAAAMAGVGKSSADQHTAAGQQEAGLWGGLLGAGATMGASALAKPAVYNVGVPTGHAEGGEIPEPMLPATPFVGGGSVPGHAPVPGDSGQNDVVPARLSPGEFVVPRTAMANPAVRDFLARNVPTPRPPSPHPSDVASVMRALAELRGEAA